MGTFTNLIQAAIDATGTIAFLGRIDNSSDGIYKVVNGNVETVADFTTPIPGGVGEFLSLGQPSLDHGNVAFRGTGSNGQVGIYAEIADDLRRVADLTTPIPDGPGSFTQVNNAAITGSTVAFIGLGGTSFSHRGIYLTTPNDGILRVIDTQDTLDGKGISGFVLRKQSLVSGNLLFGVNFVDGSRAIYVVDVGVDTDGDGVLDDEDNAPNDFNPDQSDIDGDLIGDVIDPCPSDPTDSCDPAGSASESIDSSGGQSKLRTAVRQSMCRPGP